MTTAPATAPPRTSKDLVGEVLASMRDQGVDTGDALDKLARQAAATGTTARGGTSASAGTHTGTAPAPARPAAPTGLRSAEQVLLRPNGEKYYVRRMGLHDDVEVLREAQRKRLNVLLFSGPGTGKTALFEAAFTDQATLGADFEFVPGDGDTKVGDFVGGYIPMPDGTYLWADGPLTRAMERGVPLLVDEVALINPKVMAVVYSAADGRGILRVTDNPAREDVKAREGFYLVGACNPRAPGARMSEALLSRFALHVEVGIDYALMRKLGVPSDLVQIAQNIKKKYDLSELQWFPAVREMLDFRDISSVYGPDVAYSNLVTQAPEMDRPQIADIVTRALGKSTKGLMIK